MKKNEENQKLKPVWGTLSIGILKKSRQKRWQKYNGLTYPEAMKLLEHWRWHSQKLENLLEKLVKNENQIKENVADINKFEITLKCSIKRDELLKKAEKIINSDVIWTGDY